MIYGLVIFVSAFLLFLVQPLIAKQILPWFGGSAAVWATCLLFFQSALLAGYAYADIITRWLTLRRQAMLHAGLLVVAVLTMPIVAGSHWKPAGDEEPISRILLLLTATIGLPYFLLSATTPLVGAWYWKRHRSSAPYRLFALSNFASLLALLGFPFLLEPWVGNREIAIAWSVLFAVFAVLCAIIAWQTARNPSSHAHAEASVDATPTSPATAPGGTGSGWFAWATLSALGSAMLLGVSSHLTQNISSAPLLWVIPLALYLITFIVSFDHPRWYVRAVFLPGAAVLLPVMAWLSDSLELGKVTPVYALGLFVVCMAFHGELARLKPGPERLTRFYLAISVGGALGCLAMAVVAPLVLDGYFELYIMLIVAAATGLLLPLGRPGASRLLVRSIAGVVLAATVAASWQGVEGYSTRVRFMERDFYGVVRTRDSAHDEEFRSMIHGAISHGGQLLRDDLQMAPSTYFGPTSGYGRVFSSLPEGARRVGVIGLGAGALAAWAKPGDHWVFYEISPAVVRAAKTEFTFLSRMPGTHQVVVGDGRLALEREPARQFDVLAMDAFAGDSIPTHLITREAMAAYVKHLKPDGVIVFQATNRFVDLMPAIRNLADAFGMQAVLVSDAPDFDRGPEYWLSTTDQVLVTRNQSLLAAAAVREAALPIPPRKGLPIFTDDYINLVKILK